MAIFRTPKISSVDRQTLVLSQSELVYDTTESSFYGGDGSTPGGFKVGGGNDLKVKTESFLLTQENIDNKEIVLSEQPAGNDIIFFPEGGIAQRQGIDFIVSLNVISWESQGLDGFLEVDDVIQITYYYY